MYSTLYTVYVHYTVYSELHSVQYFVNSVLNSVYAVYSVQRSYRKMKCSITDGGNIKVKAGKGDIQ